MADMVHAVADMVVADIVVSHRKTPLMTPSRGEEIISTKPRWKSVFVCIFLSFDLFMLLCVPPARPYTIYTSYAYGTI